MLNQELKEVREKLVEADRQNDKLKEEMTDLGQRLQTAGVDVVRDFKAMQSFIDSCAKYYGTGFDDCFKQVALAFPGLDLSRITMDDEGDGSSQPNPSTPTSNAPTALVDVEDQQADRNPTNAPAP